jgi:hypothetical protein
VKKLQIVLLSVLAACSYGVIHDQITARLCIEYFTVAHPPLFHTGSTTLLALCWGVAATAGIGAALGVVLALVSQSDGPTPYPISRLGRSLLLLAIMAASAFVAGVVGYQLSHGGFISIPSGFSEVLRAQQHDRFMAVWFAHGASYLVGLGGGALLCSTYGGLAASLRSFLCFRTREQPLCASACLPQSLHTSYGCGSVPIEKPPQIA